jgi:hypothetical protein
MGFLTGNKKINSSNRSFMGKIPRRVEFKKGIIRELKPYERKKYEEYFRDAKVGSKSIKSLARDLGAEQGMMRKRKFLAAVKKHYEEKYPVLSEEKKRINVIGSKTSDILNYRKEKGGISVKDRKDRGEEAHERAHEKRFAGSEADLGIVGYKERQNIGYAGDASGEKRTSIGDVSNKPNKLTPDKKFVPPSKPSVNPLGK